VKPAPGSVHRSATASVAGTDSVSIGMGSLSLPLLAHRALRLALLTLTYVVLMLGLSSVAAHAEGYGELASFGKGVGSGNGQLKLTSGTHAFGVDPTDNSVYVGDEPTEGEYRIQKLSDTGEFLGSASFKPANPIALEGIAVDPVKERVYVLAVALRGNGNSIDPATRAAGALYAFKTKPAGGKLESAVGGTGKEVEEGVLAGPAALETESSVQGHALLEPSGLAVDPSTHDVIVMGSEDKGLKGGVPQLRVVFQRVSEKGVLGSRYVDQTNCFGGQGSAECEAGGTNAAKAPSSPVVSQGGRVYVETNGQIWEIPSDFTSSQPPKSFVQFSLLLGETTLKGPHEELVEFPGEPVPASGGALTIVPEGATGGTIYSFAKIAQEKGGELGQKFPGAVAFKYFEHSGSLTEATEIGWTGGQNVATGGGKCTISFLGGSRSVAAGKENDLFVLDPDPATSKHGAEPHVAEFGPGGTGCPAASATAPSATVGGQPLPPSETVSSGTPVTFSSTVTQANALSVEWNFGDGQTKTESADEYLHTEVTHAFVRGGDLTVTETIHTDDLATPTLVEQTKVSVSATALPPVAVLEGPAEVFLGGGSAPEELVYGKDGGLELVASPSSGEATFDGSASYDQNPGPNQIASYHWEFGDGESETTDTPTTRHTYTKVAAYTVVLTVTDAHGLTSEASRLTVRVDEPPPKPVKHEEKSGAPAAAPLAGTSSPSAAAPAPAPSFAPVPNARLANDSLGASSTGKVPLEVTCPPGESSCTGTVTLSTLAATSSGAGAGHRSKKKGKAISVKLASGTFTVAGGQERSVTLRLSAQARALLARTPMLLAQATIVARDPVGATHVSQTPVVLRASKTSHGHSKRS
jgi:PKD repeat protein